MTVESSERERANNGANATQAFEQKNNTKIVYIRNIRVEYSIQSHIIFGM